MRKHFLAVATCAILFLGTGCNVATNSDEMGSLRDQWLDECVQEWDINKTTLQGQWDTCDFDIGSSVSLCPSSAKKEIENKMATLDANKIEIIKDCAKGREKVYKDKEKLYNDLRSN